MVFTKIDLMACGEALKGLPFGKKRWLVKHLTGFCAVERMMFIREKLLHDLCPVCLGPDESVNHGLSRPDPRVRLHWIKAIDKLCVSLTKIKTDPDIINAIRKRFASLRAARYVLLYRTTCLKPYDEG
jgi:hypothetical protein